MDPVFAHTIYDPTESAGLQWVLGGIDALLAVVGIVVAWYLWRGRSERPALTPKFLEHVWYWDDFYDAVIGRPGQRLAAFSADVIDTKVIDGAVNGVGALAVAKARALRTIQTGQLRQYALVLLAGVAFILLFILLRVF